LAWQKLNRNAEGSGIVEDSPETLPDPKMYRNALAEAGKKILFVLNPTQRETLRTYLDVLAINNKGSVSERIAIDLHQIIDPEEPVDLTDEQITQLDALLQ
jgi:hypothetical protein